MPKKAISPETKRLAKEKAAQAKAEALERNALAYLPKEREKRVEEIFSKRDRLKEELKDASSPINDRLKEQNKRVAKVYGVIPRADKIIGLYRGCKNHNEFNAVHIQVSRLLADINWPLPAQGELDLEAVGKGGEEDEGSLFDQTEVGRRQKKERPEERHQGTVNGSVDPRQPSQAIPLDEAQKKFEEAWESKLDSEQQIAREKADNEAQKQRDAAEFEKDQQANVVTLHHDQPKRRGRKPIPAEEKARRVIEKMAAKQEARVERARAKSASKKSIAAAADRAEEKPDPSKLSDKSVRAAADRAEQALEKPGLHSLATDAQRQVFESKWSENPLAAIEMARMINRVCGEVENRTPLEAIPLSPLPDDDLPEIADEPDEPSGGYGVVL